MNHLSPFQKKYRNLKTAERKEKKGKEQPPSMFI